MKKTMFFLFILLISYHTIIAQAPSWSVKENEYQYTMTFVAKLNADGKQLISATDKVGAFVGNTCRGVSGVTYVASEKNYYAFLTVFSNEQAESINFKLYDSATNKINSVSKQIVFVVNEHKGSLFQSYSIAEPALNNTSTILTFNFVDIKTLSSTINNGQVKVGISQSYPLTDLKPVYTLSKGAILLKNRVAQKSGEIIENFSSSVNYQVLSEDESTLNNYNVSVSATTDPTLYYKKDAVCYAAGAIKVVSKQEGIPVSVTSNGTTIATKSIINGEATFTDLDADSYIVTLDKEFKIINILLKDK